MASSGKCEMKTYRSILGCLSIAALECNAVTLVLETLRSDETLDLGGLGVWLLALILGLDFTADDELADLLSSLNQHLSPSTCEQTPQENVSRE